jgi:hypothetical protein
MIRRQLFASQGRPGNRTFHNAPYVVNRVGLAPASSMFLLATCRTSNWLGRRRSNSIRISYSEYGPPAVTPRST